MCVRGTTGARAEGDEKINGETRRDKGRERETERERQREMGGKGGGGARVETKTLALPVSGSVGAVSLYRLCRSDAHASDSQGVG